MITNSKTIDKTLPSPTASRGENLIDLNDYGQFLTPYKRDRNCFHCPICDGKLSISRSNGQKFTCYGGGCDRGEIRRAVLELAGESRINPELERRRERLEQERREAEAARVAALKSEQERDREWKQIVDNLWLSDSHRQEMRRRGWSEEWIERSKARSSAKGRVIPITTAEGLMVGSQVVLDEGGKNWYGTAGTHHLQETGELPLTVIYPENPRAGIIALVESTLDKPGLTAQNFSLVTIGSSNIGSQPKDLERSITAIKRRMGWDELQLVLMVDAGMLSNNAVLSNYRRLKQQVEALGYRLLVGWWNQIDKSDGDIDEIRPDTAIEKISFDRFEEIVKKHNGLLNRFFRQFRPKKERVKPQPAVKVDEDAIEYTTTEEHRALLQKAIDEGYKVILDTTHAGGFKSTTAATIPDYGLDGVDKYFYITNTHRNPTTLGVETKFDDFPSRHKELFINPDKTTPNGQPFLQTSQPKGTEWKAIAGNCHQAELHHVMAAKGYDLNGDDNPICKVCPQLNACHHAMGAGYGYKHAKRAAMEKERLRISPQSLPHPDYLDYSQSALMWDDERVTIQKQIEATERDFNETLAHLAINYPELLPAIAPITAKLKKLFSGELKAYHGFSHSEVIDGIGEIDPAILHEIAAATAPNFEELVQEVDGIDTTGMSAKERRAVKSLDRMMAQESKRENRDRLNALASNWLTALLEVVIGGEGYVRFSNGRLIIVQPDNYHRTIIERSKLSIFLDATATREGLARSLGIEPDKVMVIRKPQPSYPNLTIKQVLGLGTPRKDRSPQLVSRLDALTTAIASKHHNFKSIDWVRDGGKGLWFADSRGTNLYKDCDALALIGSPVPNLGAMAAEFSILYGRQVDPTSDDREYREFISDRIGSELTQAIARLRSHLTPGEQKVIYLVAEREDLPLDRVLGEFPGCKFQQVEAIDVATAAAKPKEQLKYLASVALLKLNRIPTQKELAEIVGTTQSNISKLLKECQTTIRKIFQLLLGNLYSDRNIFDDLPPSQLIRWEKAIEREVIDYVSQTITSSETDRASKVANVVSIAEALTSQQLQALIGLMGRETRDRLLELMVEGLGRLIQPSDELATVGGGN